MSIIEIYFYGLICHIGPDDGAGIKNAALVATTTHLPRAVLGGGTLTEVDLATGDVLSLSIGTGDALKTAAFDAFVPSLVDKTDKTSHQQALKHGVRTSQNFDVAVAYFDHSKSSLDVAALYPGRAVYTMRHKKRTEQCAAFLTLASVQTNETDVRLVRTNSIDEQNNGSWPIRDWVLIANLFHARSLLHGDHFGNHLKLTDATEIAQVTEITNGCKEEQQTFPSSTNLTEVSDYINAQTVAQSLEIAGGAGLVPFDLGQADCSDTRWP
jgi:hypothetical protein